MVTVALCIVNFILAVILVGLVRVHILQEDPLDFYVPDTFLLIILSIPPFAILAMTAVVIVNAVHFGVIRPLSRFLKKRMRG